MCLLKKTVYIIGGGAAGFFCAINLSERCPEYNITILEKTGKLLSKVLVSGGGRCNTTHFCFDNNQLVQNYPRGYKELKAIFSRFSVKDTIDWFEKRGVHLHAEADGRMFPSTNSSQTIIDCFMEECKMRKISIRMNTEVKEILSSDGTFKVKIKNSDNEMTLAADTVIVTAGGFPMKKGYDFLMKTGHTIVTPIPSLYTFNLPGNKIIALMGVSVPNTEIKISGTKFSYTGPLLITHWGFSGPAVLKLSAFAADYFNSNNYKASIIINWISRKQEDLREYLTNNIFSSKSLPKNSNEFGLPRRLWDYLLEKAEIDANISWEEISKKKKNKIIELLCADVYEMHGKTTFKEEFVTCGGIALNEVDCKRMESKLHPGLFFAGEVLNIDGITGGFNFQAAWSTAWIVAQSIL